MPEFLAPGVCLDEVSFRAKSIEGVSTATTGFIGATRFGAIDIEPKIVTSLVEYERAHGGKAKLNFADSGETDNYMWNAVRAFFEEAASAAMWPELSRLRMMSSRCRGSRGRSSIRTCSTRSRGHSASAFEHASLALLVTV